MLILWPFHTALHSRWILLQSIVLTCKTCLEKRCILFSALYIKPSFLAKIVLKLFSILSLWTRKVDLQSFTKEWKNWQKCKLDFHVKNTQYKDLPYCFSTLYSKKQWPMKLSDYYCPNFSLFPFLAKRSLKVRIWSVTTILMIGFESI